MLPEDRGRSRAVEEERAALPTKVFPDLRGEQLAERPALVQGRNGEPIARSIHSDKYR